MLFTYICTICFYSMPPWRVTQTNQSHTHKEADYLILWILQNLPTALLAHCVHMWNPYIFKLYLILASHEYMCLRIFCQSLCVLGIVMFGTIFIILWHKCRACMGLYLVLCIYIMASMCKWVGFCFLCLLLGPFLPVCLFCPILAHLFLFYLIILYF